MESYYFQSFGGEGGIRTHGTRKGSTVFETARFNRSRTSPGTSKLAEFGRVLQRRWLKRVQTCSGRCPVSCSPVGFVERKRLDHRNFRRRCEKILTLLLAGSGCGDLPACGLAGQQQIAGDGAFGHIRNHQFTLLTILATVKDHGLACALPL